MRPSAILLLFVGCFSLINGLFYVENRRQLERLLASQPAQQALVQRMGLSDLALSTEARYTRHPSLTDKFAPFMDHPGSLEHFPSGAFVLPPPEMR